MSGSIFSENLNTDKVLIEIAELNKLQVWNHNIQISERISTKPGDYSSFGKNERKVERLEFLKPLVKGSTVLDIGCNEGYFSCKFLEWEAKGVLGIDIDEKRLSKARFVRSLLKSEYAKKFDINCKSVYDFDFSKISVDVVFALGFLHRLPNPFEFLMDILSLDSRYFVFEFKTTRADIGGGNGVIEFSPYGIDVEDFYGTEYFRFSKEAFERMVKRISPDKHIYYSDDLSQQRLIAVVSTEPVQLLSSKMGRNQKLRALRILIAKFTKDMYRLCIK